MNLHKNNDLPSYLIIFLPISFLIGSFFVNFVSILLSLYAFIWILKNKKYNIFIEKKHIGFTTLFLIFIISSLQSNYMLVGFRNSFSYFSNFLIFLSLNLIFLTDNKKQFNISKIVFFIMIFICIDLWIQKIIGNNILGFPSQQAGRLTSIFKDEQIPGGVLFKLSPFAIYYLFTENKESIIHKSKFMILIFIYFSILITGERAASILSTLLGLLLLILNINLIDRKKLFSYVIVILVVFFTLFSLKNSVIKERIYYTFIQSKNNIYITLYNNSLNIFKDNYLIGTGPQSYRHVCHKKYDNCSTHPHNFLLELLSDAGFLAPIILFISLITMIIGKVKSSKNRFFNSLTISYSILFFFPIIPTGSFFSSFHMTLIWFSLGFVYSIKNK